MFKFILFVIGLVVLLSACSGIKTDDGDILRLFITPNLANYQQEIVRCSIKLPGHILLETRPIKSLATGEYSTLFHIGEPPRDSVFSTEVGSVTLTVVINSNNPISQLETDDLRLILLGIQTDWQAVAPKSFTSPETIQVWTYPQGDDIRGVLEDLLLDGRSIPPTAHLAPDFVGMLAAIQGNPSAIGYLPDDASLSTPGGTQIGVKAIFNIQTPIIASFPAMPGNELKELMVCLKENE